MAARFCLWAACAGVGRAVAPSVVHKTWGSVSVLAGRYVAGTDDLEVLVAIATLFSAFTTPMLASFFTVAAPPDLLTATLAL